MYYMYGMYSILTVYTVVLLVVPVPLVPQDTTVTLRGQVTAVLVLPVLQVKALGVQLHLGAVTVCAPSVLRAPILTMDWWNPRDVQLVCQALVLPAAEQ